jgi:putative oxidoreductase
MTFGKFLLHTDDSAAQLWVRLALGVVMLPHGAQKLLGWFGGPGWNQTIEIFAGLGFPPWSSALLILLESVGALLLIVGFLTRIMAAGFLTSISICMLMNHVRNGFFMNWYGNQQGEGFEYHLLVIGIAIALLIKGGGKFSVDRALSLGQ